MANICEIRDISPKIEIEQVTLERPRDSGPDIITVEGNFQEVVTSEASRRWYEDSDYLNYMRLRVVFSFSPEQTKGLYYLKDAFNAYLSLSKPPITTAFGLIGGDPEPQPYTAEQFATHIEGEYLSEFPTPLSHLLNDGGHPHSPFQTSAGLIPNEAGFYFPNRNQAAPEYNNLAYFDKAIVDILPRDLLDPDQPRRSVLEPDPSRSRSTGDEAIYLTDSVEITPIVLSLPEDDLGVPIDAGGHLSLHAFVYLDYERFLRDIGLPTEQYPIAINTGMGPVMCVTPIGTGYDFRDITVTEEDPLAPGGPVRVVADPDIFSQLNHLVQNGEFETLQSPDRDILHDLRFQENISPGQYSFRIHDRLFNTLRGSTLEQPAFYNIHRDDSFSQLYLSRGLNDNARYIFHYDLIDYLAQNSYFPMLYSRHDTARDILEGQVVLLRRRVGGDGEARRGTPVAIGPGKSEQGSQVLNMTVVRRRVGFTEGSVSNDLPTLNKNRVIGPSDTYKEEIIVAPQKLEWKRDINILRGGFEGIEVYEGCDFFNHKNKPKQYPIFGGEGTRQSPAKYQYGAEVTVMDAAPAYLKKCHEIISTARDITREVYSYIINSAPRTNQGFALPITDGRGLYDYGTGKMTVHMHEVVYFRSLTKRNYMDYPAGSTVKDVLEKQILIYVDFLRKFNIQFQDDRPNFVIYHDGEVILAEAFQRQDEEGNLHPDYDALERHLVETLRFRNPEIIVEISKAIGMLASSVETILSSYFSDLNPDPDPKKKSTLEQKGVCQRKLILLNSKHYFEETFTYGIQNQHGYSYLLDAQFRADPGGLGVVGLARLSEQFYKQRATMEFIKYFVPGKGAQLSAITENALAGQFAEPSYKYFSPWLIKPCIAADSRNEIDPKNPVNQIKYIRNLLSADYNLDDYGELLADIMDFKYQTKYLNRVFYHIAWRLKGRAGNLEIGKLRALYDSIMSSLGNVYKCNIDEYGSTLEYRKEFNRLKPSLLAPRSPSTPGQTSLTTRVPLTLEGGLSDATPAGVGINLTDLLPAEQLGPDAFTPNRSESSQAPPIKLSFGILGELEFDPHIAGTTLSTYENNTFNSLTNLRDELGLTEANIVNSLEQIFPSLPNQIKSMLITATSNQTLNFGQLDYPIDARRVTLFDDDAASPEHPEHEISYYNRSMNFEGTYETTKDPMKIYAKMAAFWLNYKQLCVVEYLDSFGDLNRRTPNNFGDGFISRSKVGLPVWRKLEPTTMADIKAGSILCRIRTANEVDLQENLFGQSGFGSWDHVRFAEHKELFDLPIYNEYFLLFPGQVITETSRSSQGRSSAAQPAPMSGSLPLDLTLGGAIGQGIFHLPRTTADTTLGGAIGGSPPATEDEEQTASSSPFFGVPLGYGGDGTE